MKRSAICRESTGHPPFPPGKSGGLIEAAVYQVIPTYITEFPPGKSGGLIEARTPC